jgi:hypothetical protein
MHTRQARIGIWLVCTAAVSLLLAGCDADVRMPVQPSVSPSTTPSPTPSPTSPLTSGVTLSGQILEVAADGTRRPIGARQLSVEVEVNTPQDPQRGGWVPVGADGRYRLSNVPDGRFVKITYVDIGRATEHRFCATNTITRGDTELDVSLYLPGAPVPPHTVSGQVFRIVAGKRLPVARTEVYFRTRAYGADAVSGTDAEGRYSLCGLPEFQAHVYMFCGNDVVPYDQPIVVRGNTVHDIDATTFHDCLWFPASRARTRFR